ncbi:Heat stress transcription factor A-8 [Saguinus oedipus]|uniref:Heat stress transcription factor A-8 n=1 Tax=Saguinus oedipus TaxID=9490 RepID=A0ABQ9TJU3_SAGOE|nr:Heat stress transcription factor A-8 [Saguinus oedipus]
MEEALLSTPINPNNFPAKLWRLVNSPRYLFIRWDGRGEGLLIDQPLFEAELLSPPGPGGRQRGRGARDRARALQIHQRHQLHPLAQRLRLPQGQGPGPGPGGSGSAGDRPLHHFHSAHFRRDQPQLLVHRKRLTSANKAKLEAGLEVPCRPPNGFQRLLITSDSASAAAAAAAPIPAATPGAAAAAFGPHGPVAVGQRRLSFRRDSLSPYSYGTSSHDHSTFPMRSLDRTPIPHRIWQKSLGMHPGQVETSPTFSDKGVPFPVLQRFPADVTYTLQPSATSVHVQQGPQTMVSSSQKYSNYTPSVQYSQAYYPTAVLQCCSSTRMDALSSCVTPLPLPMHTATTSRILQCNPPIQLTFCLPIGPAVLLMKIKRQVNLEAVFQIVDELRSSPTLEMIKVEPVENQCPTSQSNRGQHILANSNNNNPCSARQASQLEPLPPSPEYLYTIHTAQPVEKSSLQESASIPQAHVKLKEQLNHSASPSSVVFVQEGLPCSTYEVDANIKCQTSPPENILPSEQMGFLISEMGPASKPSKDTGVATPARYRQRRSNSQQGRSPDLHLLVDVACKQEHFPKEEELKERGMDDKCDIVH